MVAGYILYVMTFREWKGRENDRERRRRRVRERERDVRETVHMQSQLAGAQVSDASNNIFIPSS